MQPPLRVTVSYQPWIIRVEVARDDCCEEAWQAVGESFEQFCLIAGLSSLTQMLDEDAN